MCGNNDNNDDDNKKTWPKHYTQKKIKVNVILKETEKEGMKQHQQKMKQQLMA